MENMRFTHFDEHGNAVMVDVSEKAVTCRTALAQGSIYVNEQVMESVLNHTLQKGDVLAVAQIAGIMGVKQTASLVPMCHTIPIYKCSVELRFQRQRGKSRLFAG